MKFLFAIFCFIKLTTIDHDVPIAMFKIHEEHKKILLDVTFDTEDLAIELNLTSRDISKDLIGNYLGANTSFIFDGEINELEVIDLKFVGDHIKVHAVFESELTTIKQLKIVNTCLVNVASHSNIIQLYVKGSSKDYRMHKKRNTITIDL